MWKWLSNIFLIFQPSTAEKSILKEAKAQADLHEVPVVLVPPEDLVAHLILVVLVLSLHRVLSHLQQQSAGFSPTYNNNQQGSHTPTITFNRVLTHLQ